MRLRTSQKILLISGLLTLVGLFTTLTVYAALCDTRDALCAVTYPAERSSGGQSTLRVAEIRADAARHVNRITPLIPAAVFGILLAGLALAHTVLAPLRRLRTAADLIGRGEAGGPLPPALAIDAPVGDEFREVAGVFQEMASRLRATTERKERLEARQEQLQETVRGLFQEVQERVNVEWTLREREERYARAVRGSNDGLWDWDLEEQSAFFSPRWKAMLGAEESESSENPAEWLDRIHPDDRERVQAELAAHLDNHAPHFQSEHRLRHEAGHYLWVLCRGVAIRDGAGRALRLAGSQTDISDKKAVEEQLLHEALHDGLTALPNRALFMDRLGQALLRAKGWRDYSFAVLFLDLDRFKIVNDSLGHAVGDQLLIEVASRLRACVRPGDTVARLGGDEFTVLLENVREAGMAESLCDRIQRELRTPLKVEGQEVFTTASIGIVLYADGYERPEELLRDADVAMYCAKAHGKARYELFDTECNARANALHQLEVDLRNAISAGEFQVHYQPIVSAVTGEITAVEALARWHHPTRGLLPPGEFLPLAEKTGLIVTLGAWLLRTACVQLRQWRQAGNYHLSLEVNLSALQFESDSLLPLIRDALAESRIPADALVLEISETMAMQGVHRTLEILNALRALGVEIAIDDFGTGYSSLAYLKRFPLRVLKIDRSFIRDVVRNSDDAAITSGMIALAHRLGLRVVAEGVETAEQWIVLRRQGCDEAQGYFFSRPLPADELTRVLEASFHSDRLLPARLPSAS